MFKPRWARTAGKFRTRVRRLSSSPWFPDFSAINISSLCFYHQPNSCRPTPEYCGLTFAENFMIILYITRMVFRVRRLLLTNLSIFGSRNIGSNAVPRRHSHTACSNRLGILQTDSECGNLLFLNNVELGIQGFFAKNPKKKVTVKLLFILPHLLSNGM